MRRQTYIYFAAPVGGGPIKIGCSSSPIKRLEELTRWSPVPLEILATVRGDLRDEMTLHAALLQHWSHREWFKASCEIYALIAEIRATGVIPEAYRWRPGRRMGVPRRRWTDEMRKKASIVHIQAWADRRAREERRQTSSNGDAA